jgi:hypothetical protein
MPFAIIGPGSPGLLVLPKSSLKYAEAARMVNFLGGSRPAIEAVEFASRAIPSIVRCDVPSLSELAFESHMTREEQSC